MQLLELFHKMFENVSANVDKRLHKTTLLAALSAAKSRQVSISTIGRHLESTAKVKHNIKRIDRLFNNKNLYESRTLYYQKMIDLIIGSNQQPIIIVDWSGLTPCGQFHFIRASSPAGGRALTLYEEAFTESEYGSKKAHRQFLKQLQALLPKNCKPIMVTDAGFRCPWFKEVQKLGWDFVGRIRHNTQYFDLEKSDWLPVKQLYSKAKQTPNYLFKTELAKVNPVVGHFILVKDKEKRRVRKNLKGKKIQCSVSLKHAKNGREPWLLFTSLLNSSHNAKQIKQLYSTRVQIEQSFRDIKNKRNGLGLRHCRSTKKNRLSIALLISSISYFVIWVAGITIRDSQKEKDYQSNTIRNRSVLSIMSLGIQSVIIDGIEISTNLISKIKLELSTICANQALVT